MFLIVGIGFTGALLRYHETILREGRALPAACSIAIFFKEYGILFFAVILGWAGIAFYLNASNEFSYIRPIHIIGSGLILLVIITMLSIYCCEMALSL